MLGEKDLVYLGTIIFLTTKGGKIDKTDIEQATKVAQSVFDRVFDEETDK